MKNEINVMKIIALMLLIVVFPSILISETGTIDKIFQGVWIPVNRSSCSSPIKIEVSNDTIVLRNGNHSASYQDVELCYSCAGGARYDGIEVHLYAQDASPSPFIIRFNADEKEGIMGIAIKDPKMRKLFAFDSFKFKKCKP